MKNLLSLIISLFCSIAIGQNPVKDIVEFSETLKPVIQDTLEVNSEPITENIVDLKSEFWDHTVYNPFKEVEITFPLRLEFKDSTYSSPIRRRKVITSRYGWRRGGD